MKSPLHAQRLVFVWGGTPPIYSIGYDEPGSVYDSGFTVLFDDAPDPDDVAADDERLSWVCLHCIIDEHPEIGRGLDLARQHGAADRKTGEWIGRTMPP